MKREYSTGSANNVKIFTGEECEGTRCLGKNTLFVEGDVSFADMAKAHFLNPSISNIYLSANHTWDLLLTHELEKKIRYCVNTGTYFTIEMSYNRIDDFREAMKEFWSHSLFVPMISLPIKHAMLQQNLTVKIDDVGFNESNPGVWCAKMVDMHFTPWSMYEKDTPL